MTVILINTKIIIIIIVITIIITIITVIMIISLVLKYWDGIRRGYSQGLRVDKVLLSLGSQSSKDGVSIKIPVAV